MYKMLAKLNKFMLPSFTRQQLDLSKAKKWQMAIIGWRYYVTTRSLEIKK
ncbi:SsrA-binding protein [Flavobacterium sp.]|nr:SsrA-binding protein [Flavobacterium sp.]